MDKPSSYCEAIAMGFLKKEDWELHKTYHDLNYGFPIEEDNELFCRLVLEINQAGLSWTIILKKQDGFRTAYHNFNIKKVAAYTSKDFDRLMNDGSIVRNRLKINAAIENARTILQLQQEHKSFKKWLDLHHPKTRAEWTKLFKKTFRFTGGEIVNEFLMSIGYLPGAHQAGCAVYKKVIEAKPLWNSIPIKPEN